MKNRAYIIGIAQLNPLKNSDGNKIRFALAKRVAGRCEATQGAVCIAHPQVFRVRYIFCMRNAERRTALSVGTLFEVFKGRAVMRV